MRRVLGAGTGRLKLRVTAGALVLLAVAGIGAQVGLATGSTTGAQTRRLYFRAAARFSGVLTVRFRGSRAAGCAARQACGVSGVVTAYPGRSGLVLIAPGADALIIGGSGTVAARVRTTLPSGVSETCSDRNVDVLTQPEAVVRHHVATFALATEDGSLLASRCPGPLVSDVAAQLPRATVSLAAVLRGHRTIRLGSRRSFAAHGFAGTVTSTIAVVIGTVTPFPPGGPYHDPATRVVVVPLHLIGVDGHLVASIGSPPFKLGSGVPGPGNVPLGDLAGAATCARLGACGLTGQATIHPRPTDFSGMIGINAPPRLSTRQVLADLRGSRHDRGVRFELTAGWTGGGRLDQQDMQSGAACSDSVPLGEGQLQLTIRRRQLNVQYEPSTPLRTRCAGPELGTGYVNGIESLANGAVPLTALRHKRVTLTLTPPAGTYYNGYPIRLSGALTVTIELGRVRSHLIAAQ